MPRRIMLGVSEIWRDRGKVTYPKSVAEIAYELQGTCNSLHEVLSHYDMVEVEVDSEFCSSLDMLVFCCESCNWWYDVSEMCQGHGDWHCEYCYPED